MISRRPIACSFRSATNAFRAPFHPPLLKAGYKKHPPIDRCLLDSSIMSCSRISFTGYAIRGPSWKRSFITYPHPFVIVNARKPRGLSAELLEPVDVKVKNDTEDLNG